jgi:hypothetical protein
MVESRAVATDSGKRARTSAASRAVVGGKPWRAAREGHRSDGAPPAVAEELRRQDLEPERQGWLVNGEGPQGVVGGEEEVVPGEAHGADGAGVEEAAQAKAVEVGEAEDGGKDDDGPEQRD